MATPPLVRLVQLPIPPLAFGAPTGNVPLAAGSLAVAARRHLPSVDVEVVSTTLTDELGDTLLADALAADEPAVLGFSLYLWNSQRSLHLMREVKRRSPRTRIIVGGPEVSSDNTALLDPSTFDVAVMGEAEEVFAAVVDRLLRGGDCSDLPGAAVGGGRALHFRPATPATFPLTTYPSPYAADLLPVDPRRSTYVETVRGCRSHCTFCFYPRSSASLRALDVADAARTVAALRDRGAREVVFLDPTFNHRPSFDDLLDALADVNRDRRLRFFAEVRAEGLTESHADRLAACGFHRLEIGMQSVNREALTLSRRGGSAALVASAARMLHQRGIDLLIDLIVGLPGDTVETVLQGVDFLIDHGLGEFAQVFPLSILPGTAMRATAADDGVEFDTAPPYRVQRTETMTSLELRDALREAERRLDRRLDEEPRPYLCDAGERPGPPVSYHFDVERFDLELAARPGAAHNTLWFTGRDLWAARDAIRAAIERRLVVDPHASVDVVLCPRDPPPLDLIAYVRGAFATAPPSYAARWLAHRGEDAKHRVSIVMDEEARWPHAHRIALMEQVPVFRNQSAREALAGIDRLGDDLPGARIVGEVTPADGQALIDRAPLDSLAFADRRWEQRLMENGLGLAEIPD